MALTPSTTLLPYCSAEQFLLKYDIRLTGQMVNDAGGQATTARLTAPDSALQEALLAGSGELELACVRGGRYKPEDLQGLVGAGAAIVRDIVAALAVDRLMRRRIAKPPNEVLQEVKWARDLMKELANGELVFPFVEAGKYSFPYVVGMSEQQWVALKIPTTAPGSQRFWGYPPDRMG